MLKRWCILLFLIFFLSQVMLASAVVTGGEKTGDLEGGEGMTVVGGGFGPGDRLLQAIQGQRDRFRKEAQVLDSERSILKVLSLCLKCFNIF